MVRDVPGGTRGPGGSVSPGRAAGACHKAARRPGLDPTDRHYARFLETHQTAGRRPRSRRPRNDANGDLTAASPARWPRRVSGLPMLGARPPGPSGLESFARPCLTSWIAPPTEWQEPNQEPAVTSITPHRTPFCDRHLRSAVIRQRWATTRRWLIPPYRRGSLDSSPGDAIAAS